MELRGERGVLRPVDADDVDDLVALFAEPRVARWFHDSLLMDVLADELR